MSRRSELNNRLGDLRARRSSLSSSIQADTKSANSLSNQISAKDQAIQRAEAFRDDTCSSLQTNNDALGSGLTHLGSEMAKGTGESDCSSSTGNINKGNSSRIDAIRTQCNNLIDRLNRERGSLQSRLNTVNANITASRGRLDSVNKEVGSTLRQLDSLPDDDR